MYRFQPTNFHVSILGLEHSDLGFVSALKNVCLNALEYVYVLHITFQLQQ